MLIFVMMLLMENIVGKIVVVTVVREAVRDIGGVLGSIVVESIAVGVVENIR